jgi:hypothetical protein
MIEKSAMDKETFLQLSTREIRDIIKQRRKPRVGVFIADGNRRLVMCKTGLKPSSDEFYQEYARFFTESLKKTLEIFFDHGLETLFFPLFGPSLLKRKNSFQTITIPTVYREVFQSEEWLQFFKEKGIRIKVYGDLSRLKDIDPLNLDMEKGILETVAKTAHHQEHTLFLGFMSDNTPGMELPGKIIKFYKTHGRIPTHEEMVTSYYGELVPQVDLLILSNKLSSQGAFPPLIANWDASVYYLPVPGFESLSEFTLREIIYDFFYVQNVESIDQYNELNLKNCDQINDFYRQNKNVVVGAAS